MKRVDRHDDAVAGLALDAAHVNCDMQHADLADDTAFMPVDLHERQGAEKDPAQAAQNEAQAVAEARDAAVAALAEAVVPADGDMESCVRSLSISVISRGKPTTVK